MRAVPLGVGELTSAKRNALMQLSGAILSRMREMAAAGFSPEPLKSALTGKALDDVLLDIQKRDNTLNSVWREQARMRVKPALAETVRRYFSRLAGGLRHLDQAIPQRERKECDQRRYYHIPETVQDSITLEEIRELQTLAEKGKAIEAFRQWIDGQHDFSPQQVAVLEYLHERAQRKHNPPDFGARDDFVLQIPIDARMVPRNETPPALALRQGASFLLEDDGNRCYYRFLDIAGLRPRATHPHTLGALRSHRETKQRIRSGPLSCWNWADSRSACAWSRDNRPTRQTDGTKRNTSSAGILAMPTPSPCRWSDRQHRSISMPFRRATTR